MRLRGIRWAWTCTFLAAFSLASSLTPHAHGQASAPAEHRKPQTGATGLPLPRFVSLRAEEVNLRTGPGLRYPIDWVYRRRGLPVEVITEFEAWRRVRDWEGTIGWVHQSMLQGRRTVLVTAAPDRLLRKSPNSGAYSVAQVEPGVIGVLEACNDAWCEVRIAEFKGWLRREQLYGIYPDEQVP